MKPARKLGSLCGSGAYPKVTCCTCGKIFTLPCPRNKYRFKRQIQGNDAYFCGWACKREWEREHPRKRQNIWLDYLI